MQADYRMLGSALVVAALSACAHAVPKELTDARVAYAGASHGPVAQLAPIHLYKAKIVLDRAERAFVAAPAADATRDLSYVALRKTQLAEVVAARALEAQLKAHAERDLQSVRARKQMATSEALAQARRDKTEAKARNKAMEERLSHLAAVRDEARGTVLTLSDSLLFSSNKAILLPAAQSRLDQVKAALMSNQERTIRIEGYTDSRGSEASNLALSQRRADAVRSYLVSRGFEAERVQAFGRGEAAPVASNDAAKGRADNRRVEIVIEPQK